MLSVHSNLEVNLQKHHNYPEHKSSYQNIHCLSYTVLPRDRIWTSLCSNLWFHHSLQDCIVVAWRLFVKMRSLTCHIVPCLQIHCRDIFVIVLHRKSSLYKFCPFFSRSRNYMKPCFDLDLSLHKRLCKLPNSPHSLFVPHFSYCES